MGDSEETLKQENEVLKAIAELSAKVDSYQKSNEAQFEAIRQGIFDNSIRFERIEGEIYKLRGEFKSLKADITELAESVRRKELV